jgi:hypothetical protein
MILNIFDIDYNVDKVNLFKEFLLDNKLSLEALVNDLLNKCRNISMKIYGIDLYNNYLKKHKDFSSFMHTFLLNDFSVLHSAFKWDFDFEVVKKLLNSENVNNIIDNKIELLNYVLSFELTKKNITYQIDKLILITNDILKLFELLDNDKKKIYFKQIYRAIKNNL